MKRRRILAVLLALVLALSVAAPALAAEGEDNLTRGEFLAALYAMSGAGDPESAQADFDDISPDSDLAPAIRWAVDSGIVNGYGNGKFGPGDPVTREQMAAMLYRTARMLGQGFAGMWMFPLDYPDAAELSGWAEEPMRWVLEREILAGTDKGLEPKTPVAADQLAYTLERWQKAVPMGIGIRHEEEFGGAYILLTIEAFNGMNFTYGDSLRIAFSNGYVMEDIPYYNGYYTDNGEPLLVAYPGYPYIKAGINNGDDLFALAGLGEEDTATVSLLERGKYAEIQYARDIHYSDKREDYETDAEFANFRQIRAGNLLEGILCRSASPCDNQHNRATYVDALLEEAGVAFILNLSDNAQKIRNYLEDPDFACPHFLALYEGGKVEPIALNMNYSSAEFRAKVAAGLSRMAEEEGPYLVHCTEGKDRTGFVCMLLEALCGATFAEITADYTITYDNYYGITEETEKTRYDVIVSHVLEPMVRSIAGGEDADVRTVDLAACAEQFLLDGGMSPEQIALLKTRLMGD